MDPKNDEADVEESLDLPAEPEEGEEDTTDWKAEAQKLREKAIRQRESTKTLKQRLKDKETAIEALAGKKPEPTKTGELDETQLDYLDVKGISESEDIKVIEDVVKKTGMTVRQALKDDYVVKKLESNKAARELKDATPSSTKRSTSGEGNDLELAIAKYTQSGYSPDTLPTDFKLRSAVVNAVANATKTNKPSWH